MPFVPVEALAEKKVSYRAVVRGRADGLHSADVFKGDTIHDGTHGSQGAVQAWLLRHYPSVDVEDHASFASPEVDDDDDGEMTEAKTVRKGTKRWNRILDDATWGDVYSLGNGFTGTRAEERILRGLKDRALQLGAKIIDNGDGTYTVDFHSNLWWVIGSGQPK